MIWAFIKKHLWKIISVILAIIVIILWFTNCNRKYPEGTIVTKKVFIPGKTVLVPVYSPSGEIAPPDTFWRDVDSNNIMKNCPDVMPVLRECQKIEKDYHTKRFYDRVLLNDSNYYARMKDTLQDNKLGQGSFTIDFKKPISSSQTIYGEIPRNKLYAGAGVRYDSTLHIPISLLMTTKGNWAFEAGTDIRSLVKKQINVEGKVYYKFHFKNK